MTDVAGILASYRAGQISEADMVDICKTWPEVEAALKATSITQTHAERVQAAINAFNDRSETEDFYGDKVPVRARKPILFTDCDYEIVRISGVQGVKL